VPPFGGLRGNVHGSFMARWKARGRLHISANLIFCKLLRLRCFERILIGIVVYEEGVGHFKRKFQGEGGRPPTTFGVRKLESLGYHVALFV